MKTTRTEPMRRILPLLTALTALLLAPLWSLHAAEPAKQKRTGEPNDFQIKTLGQYHTQDHIIYKTVNGESLELLLILPIEKPSGKMPLVLYVHGGGWTGGDKYMLIQKNCLGTMSALLDKGIGFASVEYRLAREGRSTAYDCVVDCKDAARFLTKNADRYGLDPTRFAVWGSSAGGHLSLMTGLAPNDSFKGDPALAGVSPAFQCILSYFPLTSFINVEIHKGSKLEQIRKSGALFGGEVADKMELAKLLSPSEHLTKNSPPVYLIHGDNDTTLAIKNSEYLKKLGDERGANVHLTPVKGGGHLFVNGTSPTLDEINAEGAAFLSKYLKP
jgi:acetyl esterase/lipase